MYDSEETVWRQEHFTASFCFNGKPTRESFGNCEIYTCSFNNWSQALEQIILILLKMKEIQQALLLPWWYESLGTSCQSQGGLQNTCGSPEVCCWGLPPLSLSLGLWWLDIRLAEATLVGPGSQPVTLHRREFRVSTSSLFKGRALSLGQAYFRHSSSITPRS